MQLQNDFDPFRRLQSRPFSTGRKRALSVDSHGIRQREHQPLFPALLPLRANHRRLSSSSLAIPTLEPIMEEDPEFGDEIENIFN